MFSVDGCSGVLRSLRRAEGVPAHVATVGGRILGFFWNRRCGGACSGVTRTPPLPLSFFCKVQESQTKLSCIALLLAAALSTVTFFI